MEYLFKLSDKLNVLFSQFKTEMARRMYDGFQNVSSNYPSNFNNTEEEIVTIDGKQYIKRRKILKKTGENTAVSDNLHCINI